MTSDTTNVKAGHLADNIAGFADLLRRSGMALGFDSAGLAAEALATVDMTDRRQAKAALSAALVKNRRDRALFSAAFALFWREPTSGFTAEAARIYPWSLFSSAGFPFPHERTPSLL